MRQTVVACSTVLVLAGGLWAPGPAPAARQGKLRQVYFAAFDGKGGPVSDLRIADVTVKEGGKARDIIRVEPATAPMHVAIIVDDNGSGLFRVGVVQFLNRLLDHGEFAISTITGQVLRLVDYTHQIPALRSAIDHIGPQPATPEGGQLLEGISEAARDLRRREAARPIIIALTVGGEEHSPITADQVLIQLRDSGAKLYVISVAASAIRSSRVATKPSDLLDAPMNLAEVLGDGPKQSGGHHDEIVAAAGLVGGLQQIADELLHHYIVMYALPEGAKPDERFAISTSRRGITLRAPSRIPVK